MHERSRANCRLATLLGKKIDKIRMALLKESAHSQSACEDREDDGSPETRTHSGGDNLCAWVSPLSASKVKADLSKLVCSLALCSSACG